MLSVIYAECHIQALYAECHYAVCRYAEYRYTECSGAGFRAMLSGLYYKHILKIISDDHK